MTVKLWGDGISMGTQRDQTPLARLVRDLREQKLLTQEELASRSGVSVGTVRGLESGRVIRPRSMTVRLLADALGLGDKDREALVTVARGEPVRSGSIQNRDQPRARPVQLPSAIADFTGRQEHIALVEQALSGDKDGSRAVVISAVAGKGGVGKTALAVHVAHRVAATFPDGQLYVNLRGVQADPVNPAHALSRFLRALGVDGSAIPDDLDERAELYRTRIADRRCLVVLDNAASEAQVRSLLPGASTCAVLITSRRRLTALEGAQSFDLDVFEPDQATELLAKIAGSARLAAEPEAAAALAELCGYLPLAIRIAGARLAARPHWRFADLVERLSDERRRLDELTTGDLEVRASISLSYAGLDEATRRAFRLLGLLEVPDFAVWVLAALIDATIDVGTELIDDLVSAHLVEVADTDSTGHIRYRLHDLVRLYMRERTATEDADDERRDALTRALGAWLALAGQASSQMSSRQLARVEGEAPRWSGDHAATLLDDPMAWYESERAALFGATMQACALRLDELAWELCAATYSFYDRRGLLDDLEHTHTAALALCRRQRNTLGQAVMARNLACLCEQRGRDRLLPCADEAVASSRKLGNRVLEADSVMEWGVLHRHDDPITGRARVEEGLRIADAEGHALASIHGRLWLGVMHREAGDHASAAETASHCLALAQTHNQPDYRIEALRLLGSSYRELGQHQDSEEAFTEALQIARTIGNRMDEARVLSSLGGLYVHCGRPEARPTLEQSLKLTSDLGDDFGRSLALRILGELDVSEQGYDDAITHLESALHYNRQIGYAYGEALILRALGEAHAGRGDPDTARSAWDEARRLFEQVGNTDQASAMTERLAKLPLQ